MPSIAYFKGDLNCEIVTGKDQTSKLIPPVKIMMFLSLEIKTGLQANLAHN